MYKQKSNFLNNYQGDKLSSSGKGRNFSGSNSPKTKICNNLNVGTVVTARVKKVLRHGAELQVNVRGLGPVNGFLHISEISNDRIDNVLDVLYVGDVVEVQVIENKLISQDRVSIKFSAKRSSNTCR